MNVFTMDNTRQDPYGRHRAHEVEYGEDGEEGYRRRCRDPYPYLRERFARFRELRNQTRELMDSQDEDGLREMVKKFMTIDIVFDGVPQNDWFRNGVLTVTRYLLAENLPANYDHEMLMESVERVVERDPEQPHDHNHHYTFRQVEVPKGRQVFFTIYECLNFSCRLIETVYAFLGIPMNLTCMEVGIAIRNSNDPSNCTIYE